MSSAASHNSIANDKDIFAALRSHEGLKKARASFDPLLGWPVWWLCPKLNGKPDVLLDAIKASSAVWTDPRTAHYPHGRKLYAFLKKKLKEIHPFSFESPKGVLNHVIPLTAGDRRLGYLGLSEIKKGAAGDAFELLNDYVRVLVENAAKTEELNRLSATIRPRAIALSTVHTVHRIINSTLNLSELISRLGHLTAQVLRVNRCAIYMLVKPSDARAGKSGKLRVGTLVSKALVGYPKLKDKTIHLPVGKGVEGGVAKTAEILLRKKFICIPLIDEDVIGVIHVADKKDKKEFNYFDLEILTTLAEEAVIAIKNAQLYEEQKRVTLGTIQSLAVILGTRVPAHSISPEIFLRMALRLAQEIHLGEEETQALHYATLLKDTAKIGIPDEILKKPSRLTGEEYTQLREHPIKGAKIVQSFESLKPVAPIILYSREKFDGTGYPEGLKGEAIPLGARILSVINAFEAIITGRPYRDQASLTEALDEIAKNSGTQFDPRVVEGFIKIVEKEGFYKLLRNA